MTIVMAFALFAQLWQTRSDTLGALHPIIYREIERKRIFRDDWDRNNF
jgi:hypothetical protein